MPRAAELAVLPVPSGRWEPPPPPLTVVEDDSPEAWAEFQRLQKGHALSYPQQYLLGKLGGVIAREIEPLFKDGTKFTVIARTPGNNEADVLVSNDSLDELAALIERSKSRDDLVPVVPR